MADGTTPRPSIGSRTARTWCLVAATLLVAACGAPQASETSSPTSAASPAAVPAGSSPTGGVNDLRHIPAEYLVLVSFDGFRADYLDLYETPAFDRVIDAGASAEGLIPPYPSLTFPSHYSLVTGLWPGSHGIVGNRFHDPVRDEEYNYRDSDDVTDGSWYGGEPIWAGAENQGMVAASYFWVGSEAEIAGARPTYWYPYDGSVDGTTRVDQVIDWLAMPEERRPHVVTLYFSDVDGAGHGNGPLSMEVEEAVTRVDGYLDRLIRGISTLPHGERVNIVLVSDHGMAAAPASDAVPVDLSTFPGARLVSGGGAGSIHVEGSEADVRAVHASVRAQLPADVGVHLRTEAPADLHLSGTARAGDVLVVPPIGVTVVPAGVEPGGPRWTHGWYPDDEIMHGIFIAAGPRIREGARLRAFSAVDLYPFLMELVGLEPREVDGDPATLADLIVD